MKLFREKAKRICTKKQYGEATWWEVLQYKLYLCFWAECAEFSEKNTKLTSLCDKARLNILDEKDKLAMKKELEKRS